MSFIVSMTAAEAELAKALQARLLLQDVFLWRCEADGAGPPVVPAEPVTADANFESAYEPAGGATEDFSVSVKVACHEQLTFHVKATFLIRYKLVAGPRPRPKEAEAFANTQALLTAWPYFREFVQNMTARMGLPTESLPVLRLVLQSSQKNQAQPTKKPRRKAS